MDPSIAANDTPAHVVTPQLAVNPTPAVTPTLALAVPVAAPVVHVVAPAVPVPTPAVHVPAPAVPVPAPAVHVPAPAVPVPAPVVHVPVPATTAIQRQVNRLNNLQAWNWNDVIYISSDDEDDLDVETLFGLGIDDELGYPGVHTQEHRNHVVVLNRHRVYSILHELDDMISDDEE